MYSDLITNSLIEYGTNEIKNNSINPRVLEYRSTIGLPSKAENYPWCAAFVNFILLKSGYKHLKTLSARQMINAGEKLQKPMPGCLVVFWRESIESGYGHVGFWINEIEGYTYSLSGNQNNMVSIQGFPTARVLAYIKPEKIC